MLLYTPRESKTNGLKYHYINFDKKVDISDEKKIEIEWWNNNIDNECYHIVSPNTDIDVRRSHEIGTYGHYTPIEGSVVYIRNRPH